MDHENIDLENSVVHLLANLKEGQDVTLTQQEIWKRYFERLCGLARKKLSSARHVPVDEEDVALSALNCFFEGIQAGRFPQLTDPQGLWRLLATIASRRAINHLNKSQRKKRHGKHLRGESVFGEGLDDGPPGGIDNHVEGTLTPEFADELFLLVSESLEALHEPELRHVAIETLKGLTTTEIAEQLNCSKRTVERKLERVRAKLHESNAST